MRRLRRLLLIALAALLVAAAAIAGLGYWQARSIVDQLQAGAKHAEVVGARRQLAVEPKHRLLAPKVEQARGAQTILLIGSDHRSRTAGDDKHSDTIILARIDATHHRISLLSIPRDLYVPIAGHGMDRINDAFTYGGPALLIRTVRETFGVRIDHFVEVNFAGFRKLVDTLGGIYLPVDQRYYNRNVGTLATDYSDIDLEPGYQKLNGAQALAYARFRHTDSDFYRAARQQVFLRAVLGDLLTFTPDLLALRDRAEAFAKATTSDISSLSELWWLFRAVHGTPTANLTRTTLQAQDLSLYGAFYLSATEDELRTAVEALYTAPHRVAPAATSRALARAAGPPAAQPPGLVPDGGRGAALVAPLVPIRRCAPTVIPSGYWWPSQDPARSYVLAGHPAIAAWVTAGSGRSVLFTWTTWRDPPALDSPTTSLRRGARRYEVWTEHGRIRQLAWSIGPTRVWITNTLLDELTNRQMIGLAQGCAPVGR
ncbi:MAG TPA: LCP family protein [Gaiellaceae bacterium]|nr:LCP family protein [Gaiellaceae bacterium]